MSLNVNWSNISREQLLQEYQQSPESAPLKDYHMSSMAPKEYRFETQLKRFSHSTAGELVEAATRDAGEVKQGYGLPIVGGLVLTLAGMASLFTVLVFPPLVFIGLPCIYFGVTSVRKGTDKRRQSSYDLRFAADVSRYANQAANAGG